MSKILIVDDSAFQRKLIRHVVAGQGYEVLEAEEFVTN